MITDERARKIAAGMPADSPICFAMVASGKRLDRSAVGALIRCTEEELSWLHGEPASPRVGKARRDMSDLLRWARDQAKLVSA